MKLRQAAPLLALSASILAAGCQTTPKAPLKGETPTTQASELTTPQTDFSEAVMQPFHDFNITRDPIPEPLKAASSAPYAPPGDPSCSAIVAETARLDTALGPDLDAHAEDEGAGDQVANMAAGALRSLTTGWIPFRGVLRRLTGAEAHAQAAREAILAGAVRRAYLKGLGERSGCAPPAAPRRKAPAPPKS